MSKKTEEIKPFEPFSLSNIGAVRETNQDRFVYEDTVNGSLFVVCDGMGGMSEGGVAAQTAADTIVEVCSRKWYNEPEKLLKKALTAANDTVNTLFFKKMPGELGGTTAVIALIRDNKVYYAHVGDSRLYLIKEGKLIQITKDHSLVQKLLDEGELSESEARTHPYRNQIDRAIGTHTSVAPSIGKQALSPADGDALLLCTDGLNGMVEDKTIEKIINESGKPENVVKNLIDEAINQGGNDNVTVQFIRFFNTGNAPREAGRVKKTKKNRRKRKPIIILFALLSALLIGIGTAYILLSNKDTPKYYRCEIHKQENEDFSFSSGNNIFVYSFFYNFKPDAVFILNDQSRLYFRIGETAKKPVSTKQDDR